MFVILVFLFFTGNAFAAYDQNDNRLFDQAKEICEKKPGANLAVVLTKTITKAEEQVQVGTRIKARDRVRWRYSSQEVSLLDLKSSSHYSGKYFRILDADSDNEIPIDCENLRASNVYFHLNYIHKLFQKYMFPYFPEEVQANLQRHFPIDIRINMEKEYDFINQFSENTKIYNYVVTTCGYLEKTDRYQFKEKPEILFYKPIWRPGTFHFSPACFISELKNEIPCAKDQTSTAVDTALISANIFHEYVHLVTDAFMNQCRTNMLAESFSIFSSIVMNPFWETGKGYPGMVNARYNKAKFSEKIKVYSQDSEKETQLWLSEEGNFAFQFMGKIYQRLMEKMSLMHIEAWRFVLASSFQLRKTNGDKVPRVLHLPKALKKQCLISFPFNSKKCIDVVENLEKKYF